MEHDGVVWLVIRHHLCTSRALIPLRIDFSNEIHDYFPLLLGICVIFFVFAGLRWESKVLIPIHPPSSFFGFDIMQILRVLWNCWAWAMDFISNYSIRASELWLLVRYNQIKNSIAYSVYSCCHCFQSLLLIPNMSYCFTDTLIIERLNNFCVLTCIRLS